jgi:hypothetical protein
MLLFITFADCKVDVLETQNGTCEGRIKKKNPVSERVHEFYHNKKDALSRLYLASFDAHKAA